MVATTRWLNGEAGSVGGRRWDPGAVGSDPGARHESRCDGDSPRSRTCYCLCSMASRSTCGDRAATFESDESPPAPPGWPSTSETSASTKAGSLVWWGGQHGMVGIAATSIIWLVLAHVRAGRGLPGGVPSTRGAGGEPAGRSGRSRVGPVARRAGGVASTGSPHWGSDHLARAAMAPWVGRGDAGGRQGLAVAGVRLPLHHHHLRPLAHHHHLLLLLWRHLALLLLHHLPRMHLSLLHHWALLLLHHLPWHLLIHSHLLLVWRAHGHSIDWTSRPNELSIGSPHHHALGPRRSLPSHALSHARLGGALSVDHLPGRHVPGRGHVTRGRHGGRGHVAAGPGGHGLHGRHVRHRGHRVAVHRAWTERVLCVGVRGLAGMRRLAGMGGLTRVRGLAWVVVACRTRWHTGLWGLAGVRRVTRWVHGTLAGAGRGRLEWRCHA